MRDEAHGVFALLSAPAPVTSATAAERIAAMARAVADASPDARARVDSEARALAALLVDDVASHEAWASHACPTLPQTPITDLASYGTLLAEGACPDFGTLLSTLYDGCQAQSTGELGAFCDERQQRLEQASRPACLGPTAPSTNLPARAETLRFAYATAPLHTSELDALGDAVAQQLTRQVGRPITYVSDAFDYAQTCDAAYASLHPEREWLAWATVDGTRGSLIVIPPGTQPQLRARIGNPNRPAAWLRASAALRVPHGEALGLGVHMVGSGLSVLAGARALHEGTATWRAVETAFSECVTWGSMTVVLSLSAAGRVVQASVRPPPWVAFSPPAARCLSRNLSALSGSGRETARAYVHFHQREDAHLPAVVDAPLDACSEHMGIDLCVQAGVDGAVQRWSATVRRRHPRALAALDPIPISADARQCLARVLDEGLPCLPPSDTLVLRLPRELPRF